MRHQTIVVVDVASYTHPERTAVHQRVVREGMYQALHDAFAEARVDLAACHREDRGDGVMILVPADVPAIRLADELPDRLVAALRRHNAVHSAGAAIQLRMALHAGPVGRDKNGVVGHAVDLTFRILDAPEAKNALKSSTGVLGVIASESFYHDVIHNDPASAPNSYRRIPVSVKETSTVAWLRLPDHGWVAANPEDTPGVLDVLPRQEMERLRPWLVDIAVSQLPTLVHRAGGPGVSPAWNAANAWEAFSYLAEFNAAPDGLPPALMFVELAARQIGGEIGTKLMQWNDDQARRLRLTSVLRERRELVGSSPVSEDSRLHLMIVVQADAIDPNRYLVCFWRQDDPATWPPARSESRMVKLDELERAVDELVVSAEQAWSGHAGTVGLEFVLPRELLSLPVYRWHKEHDSGDPYPLCLAYPIVVRSLERMRSPHWYRLWHQRWLTLMNDPSAQIHFAVPEETAQRHRIAAILADPQWAVMVLTEAPPPEPRPGADELTAALRSGLAALMWHPEGSPEQLRKIVSQLAENGDLSEIPGRAHASRQALFKDLENTTEMKLMRDLVILWDDPNRVVALDQASPVPQRGGGTSDDRG
nr:hypothetical protein [Pseudonocardia acaciae]